MASPSEKLEEPAVSLETLKAMREKRTIWIGGKTPPFEDHYTKKHTLGEPGAYGTTYLCVRKLDGQRCAVKELKKERFYRMSEESRKILFKSMISEIAVLKMLSSDSRDTAGFTGHPSIVKLVAVYEDKPTLRLVMEECSGGTLFQAIMDRERYTEPAAAPIAKQIISGLQYMHDTHNIVHCDLKPENILFDQKGPGARIKIIDFGMSKVLPPLKHLTHLCGTPYYTAPEIIGASKDDRHYNHMADMWSMGVILFVMLFGYPPFYADPSKYPGKKGRQAIYRRIRKGFTPKVRSTERWGFGPWFPDHIRAGRMVRDLISNLLQTDVAARYTAKEAFSHPWIKNGGRKPKSPTTSASPSIDDAKTTSDQDAADDDADASLEADSGPVDATKKVLISSIARFSKGCRFKQVVIKLFAKEYEVMRPHHFAELEKLFQEFDSDGDGVITYEEFESSLVKLDGLSLTTRQIKDVFSELDLDEMDGLKFEDLLCAVVHDYLVACDERLYRAFAELDDDEDGFITLEQLKGKLKEIDPLGEWDKAMEVIAAQSLVTETGEICYEDFLISLHPNFEEIPEWVPELYTMDSIVAARLERSRALERKRSTLKLKKKQSSKKSLGKKREGSSSKVSGDISAVAIAAVAEGVASP